MSSPRSVRAYRALLYLYPRRFREEYGVDMALLFADQLGDEPAGRVWARGAVDLAITIPTQHLETHMTRSPSTTVPFLFSALSVAGIAFALIVGSNVGWAMLGVAVAVVAGVLAVASWRSSRAVTADRPATSHWWKVLVAGVAVFTATVVAVNVTGEVPEGWWAPMMITLLAGILTTATGLILGIAHLTTSRTRPAPS